MATIDDFVIGDESFLGAVAKKSQTRQQPSDFIPAVPDGYCFVDENFLSDSFSVDGFVKRNSKRVGSLQQLKEDLAAYQRILKHSMALLINEDYSEFINLASNLISFEKSISNIKKPLLAFSEETGQVQARVDEIINRLLQKQNRIKQIQDNKLKLNMTLEIRQYVERIETKVRAIESMLERDDLFYLMLDETASLACRVQINFDHLSHNADNSDKSNPLSLVMNLQTRFAQLSNKIDSILEEEVINLLTSDYTRFTDETSLTKHLARIGNLFLLFLSNGQQKKLEVMIKTKLVRPAFNEFLNDAYIAKHGVRKMFEQVNNFLDTRCVLLIKVLTSSTTFFDCVAVDDSQDSARLSSFGYELLAGAIWEDLAQALVVRCSSLYTLANVDTFHQNYTITFRFVDEFLCKTCMADYRSAFQRLASFSMLKEKFNLNVYFFMRLQQIAPKLERSFTEFGFSSTKKTGSFKLNITQIVFDHIVALWCCDADNRVHCGDLFAYLWKLMLKMMARFTLKLKSVDFQSLVDYQVSQANQTFDASRNRRTIHRLLCDMVFDANLFAIKVSELFQTIINSAWKSYLEHLQSKELGKSIDESSLEASFNESIAYYQTMALANLLRLLHSEITNECVPILNLVNDIPRLYRRTNKDKPSRASNYIANCFTKLAEFVNMIDLETRPAWFAEWFSSLIAELTNFYHKATLEVLTSVQRTEDSLKKLKKAKQGVSNPRSNNSMSDDDKIRLQIYFDVLEFGSEMRSKMNIQPETVKSYQELVSMVSTLKSLA